MTRSIEQLRTGAAEAALTIQLRLQHERNYNPEKHFRVTSAEFKALVVENDRVTRVTNVGWFEFWGIPCWVADDAKALVGQEFNGADGYRYRIEADGTASKLPS